MSVMFQKLQNHLLMNIKSTHPNNYSQI